MKITKNQFKSLVKEYINEIKDSNKKMVFFRNNINEQNEKKPILKIIGTDGNVFSILAKAKATAKKNNMDWNKIHKEATSGNYDDLLIVLLKYFDVR